ncbi:restriction endonuclease subunit S [Buttiauxella agrestis]|uniref:restriction endonuclease subunit S n=1 Tax=Buttiauxella agrestis TaxID=82977 RepID=UPI00397578B2
MSKYKAYPEYKDSGVEWLGEIPRHWEMLRHKYVAFFTKGKNPTNLLEQPLKNTLPYLSMECLRNNTTDKYALKSNDVRIALEGQPLIIWDGSNAGEFVKGKSGILSSTMAAAILTYPLYPQYYWYLCISIEPEMRKNATGMGIPHVNGEELKRISFGIPSLHEQRKIATFLDHETARIDNLIEKQQQLIELLKEKRQAVISHAVTKGLNPDVPMKDSGVEWLGDVPEHWTVTKLGYHAIKIGSGKTPRGGSEIYLDEGILFLRSQNIYDDGLRVGSSECVFIDLKTHNEMKGTRVLEGDILLNITGGSIGRSCIVPTPFVEANVNQHVCILRFRESIREFISYAMKSSSTKEQIEACQVGGNREGLNFEQTSKINISLPPEEEIDTVLGYLKIRLSQLDTLEKNALNIILLLQERRTALISAAVTGKIDVRDWVAPDTSEVEESQEATA